MGRLFHPLLFFLARCTRNELIRQIEFLRAENEILRAHFKKHHIYVTPDERRRLLELGQAIGPALRHIISVVTYGTFRAWVRNDPKHRFGRVIGRPKTPDEIREMVLKIARETGWGYTRILGELRKLRMDHISRQTVVNILKAAKLEPGPRRGPGSWDEFLKIHAASLWQCDFFSKRVISRVGFPQLFALVFLNVATRRVWVSPCTANRSVVWMEEQARAFLSYVQETDQPATMLTRDNDRVFGEAFDSTFKAKEIEVKPLAYRAPNTNAYVERFIQTIQVECLDHFLVFGEKHFDYLVREYVEHYHTERPHQGLGNGLVTGEPPPATLGTVSCHPRIGGLLKHYSRAAA
jgi:putative transposase